MRAYVQIVVWMSASCWLLTSGLKDDRHLVFTNAIQREAAPNRTDDAAISNAEQVRPLKKVFLFNRSITCNDGSQAGFYLRKSAYSKKWIIFLEGGWYCYDYHSCRNRWIKQRQFMTSSNWPETRDVGGILSPDMKDNPYWWNANHVFVPYCTSDSWSGSKKCEKQGSFSFMGSSVVLEVVRDLIPLGLENSTDLLLAGSSAGGTGVMINLDFVKELLHENMQLKKIRVKGVTDSGWFLDRTPFAPTIKPAVDAIRKGMDLWQGRVPRRCREQYLTEPWRCYFGYRIYPTLKAELFVFQWLFDEAQMDADNGGVPVTQQQWDYIHKMGDALRHSFQNVSAVFAPSCISHSVLTTKNWQDVKIEGISVADALHCWEQKTNRKRVKRRKKNKKRQEGRRRLNSANTAMEVSEMREAPVAVVDERPNDLTKKRKRNQRKNNRGKKRGPKRNNMRRDNLPHPVMMPDHILKTHSMNTPPRRTNLLKNRRQCNKHCAQRRLERCSWPQCNRSCPKLRDPATGEELGFIELLKSFGLHMESMANALGVDMETLNNMDQEELLNLLTQQGN